MVKNCKMDAMWPLDIGNNSFDEKRKQKHLIPQLKVLFSKKPTKVIRRTSGPPTALYEQIVLVNATQKVGQQHNCENLCFFRITTQLVSHYNSKDKLYKLLKTILIVPFVDSSVFEFNGTAAF